MLENCVLLDLGDKHSPFPADRLLEFPESQVLYPSPKASRLTPQTPVPFSRDTCRTLIVLDATWRQARRISRRVPSVASLPFVTLPSGPPSSWPLRSSPTPDSLCTLEAVGRAFDALGFHQESLLIDQGMRTARERLLRMRGLSNHSSLESCP